MVEVQLGIEKDKNEKLLKNIKEIRDVQQARNTILNQWSIGSSLRDGLITPLLIVTPCPYPQWRLSFGPSCQILTF